MKLRLDLATAQPGPSRWGWLLLALGLVAAAWAGWRHQTQDAALQAARQALAARQPAKKALQAARPAAKATTGSALRALHADWGGLLSGLERGRPAQIALLGLEADAVRGSVALNANAKDLGAVLAYLDGLPAAGLSEARLESHTAMAGEGERFIQFRARAVWPGGQP